MNLAIPATLRTNNNGWISKVAGFEGTFNVEDKSLNQSMPELLAAIQGGCNSEVCNSKVPLYSVGFDSYLDSPGSIRQAVILHFLDCSKIPSHKVQRSSY